jgi:hypothetical protein
MQVNNASSVATIAITKQRAEQLILASILNLEPCLSYLFILGEVFNQLLLVVVTASIPHDLRSYLPHKLEVGKVLHSSLLPGYRWETIINDSNKPLML